MTHLVCPLHADEYIEGVAINDDGDLSFTCTRTGHLTPGDFTWTGRVDQPSTSTLSGLSAELNLDIELPAAIAKFPQSWVEYGVVEATYAEANPGDFARLVNEYGHRAITPTQYTASKYLAGILGILSRSGHIAFHAGPATGCWDYLGQVSWWSTSAQTPWEPENMVSFADTGLDATYVPGSTENRNSSPNATSPSPKH